MQKVYQGKN